MSNKDECNFDLPTTSKFKLPNKYVTIQLRSGIRGKHRVLSQQEASDIVKELDSDTDIVLIGDDKKYRKMPDLDYGSKRVINLINKTTLLE